MNEAHGSICATLWNQNTSRFLYGQLLIKWMKLKGNLIIYSSISMIVCRNNLNSWRKWKIYFSNIGLIANKNRSETQSILSHQ